MANSIVNFIETTSTKIDSLPITEGQFVFTTDTNLFYRDTATKRVLIGGNEGNYLDVSVDENENTLVFNYLV